MHGVSNLWTLDMKNDCRIFNRLFLRFCINRKDYIEKVVVLDISKVELRKIIIHNSFQNCQTFQLLMLR